MNATQPQTIVAAALGGLVIVAVLVMVRPGNGASAGAERQTLWLCDKGHEVTYTLDQIGAWHEENYGEALPCPDCGSTQLEPAGRGPTGRFVRIRREHTHDPPRRYAGPDPRIGVPRE